MATPTHAHPPEGDGKAGDSGRRLRCPGQREAEGGALPAPTRARDHPECAPRNAPLRGPPTEIPTQPARGSSPGLPRRPRAAPPALTYPEPRQPEGRGQVGRQARKPASRVAGRSELGPARGIPAERRRPGDGDGDGRPGRSGPGRAGRVRRCPRPVPGPARPGPPGDPRARAPRPRPRPRPGQPGRPTPALRAPGGSTGSVASPSPAPPPRRPLAARGRTCARRRRRRSPAAFAVPAPLRTPHTSLHTASDVTRPSARPRHCGDTASRRRRRRLRPPGGQRGRRAGEGRGGNGASGAARPRASQPLGRARRLAYCGSPRAARSRPSGPTGGARPRRARACARLPAPAPPPPPRARAPRGWPGAPSGRLAHGAVCGARRRQDVPSAPPPPPSFLPRVAQPAVWGRPRHARRRVETGQTRGRPGRWGRRAAGGGGARRAALCATPAAGRARAGRPAPPRRWPRAAPRRAPRGEPAAQTPPPGGGDPAPPLLPRRRPAGAQTSRGPWPPRGLPPRPPCQLPALSPAWRRWGGLSRPPSSGSGPPARALLSDPS
ncbi:basic proline-rich protein-like [Onychomys torridus]|uniref:basic proline-rich protein-like n=1 Tax=Onychomys torridus TaxID=38674 RepID=UPI00167F9C52|nr:basic proline-rich protein-like [Onychomys torridus]